MKAIQRRLYELLLRKLPVSAHAHGFVPGRSIASNAAPHAGKAVVIKFDIKDCFPSIHFWRVRGLLIALGYSYPVATALAVLMTEAPRQPFELNGALFHVPTGPARVRAGRANQPRLVQRRDAQARQAAGGPRQSPWLRLYALCRRPDVFRR